MFWLFFSGNTATLLCEVTINSICICILNFSQGILVMVPFFLYFKKKSLLMAFGVASCIYLSTILVFLLFLRIRSFFVHFEKKSIILWLFSHAFKGNFWAHALHIGVTEGLKIWGTSAFRIKLCCKFPSAQILF